MIGLCRQHHDGFKFGNRIGNLCNHRLGVFQKSVMPVNLAADRPLHESAIMPGVFGRDVEAGCGLRNRLARDFNADRVVRTQVSQSILGREKFTIDLSALARRKNGEFSLCANVWKPSRWHRFGFNLNHISISGYFRDPQRFFKR